MTTLSVAMWVVRVLWWRREGATRGDEAIEISRGDARSLYSERSESEPHSARLHPAVELLRTFSTRQSRVGQSGRDFAFQRQTITLAPLAGECSLSLPSKLPLMPSKCLIMAAECAAQVQKLQPCLI